MMSSMTRVALRQFPVPQISALRAVLELAGSEPVYLVGGGIRDVLLARPTIDLDVAIASGAIPLARRLADAHGGTFVELDRDRGVARVVLRIEAAVLRLDVTDFRGPTLEDDLLGRDFTVDALAVRLDELLRLGSSPIIDPSGGLPDLTARRLRPARPDVIEHDPVRALRGIRLEAQLGFRLDPGAVRIIRRVAPALAHVAMERVTQELLAILRTPRSARGLRRADRMGVLPVILPEVTPMRGVTQPAPHQFDVLEHSLRAVAAADRLLAAIASRLPGGDLLETHLSEELGGAVRRREVLKLGALLHDVAKPETRAVVDGRIRFFGHDHAGAERVRAVGHRLRLPARATRLLETLVRHHLRVMHLEQAGSVTRRARYRFFRDLGEAAQDLLLLSLVDAAALNGSSPFAVWRRSKLIRDLMAGIGEERAVSTATPLLRGDDVMAGFGLQPGPEVGRLLAQAREAQDLGLVATRDEALAYLRQMRGPPSGPVSGMIPLEERP
jgi:putative nucleotidyltransferase with HDIG domain